LQNSVNTAESLTECKQTSELRACGLSFKNTGLSLISQIYNVQSFTLCYSAVNKLILYKTTGIRPSV